MPTSYVMGLIGGAILGLTGALTMLFIGRIMGASGIFKGVLIPHLHRGDVAWRLFFLLGMVAMGWIVNNYFPQFAQFELHQSNWLFIPGAFLVGVGVTWANGCTSGHGICGMGRLSIRSFVAVACFCGAGFITVTILSLLGVQ